jgi:hypothetical protein
MVFGTTLDGLATRNTGDPAWWAAGATVPPAVGGGVKPRRPRSDAYKAPVISFSPHQISPEIPEIPAAALENIRSEQDGHSNDGNPLYRLYCLWSTETDRIQVQRTISMSSLRTTIYSLAKASHR